MVSRKKWIAAFVLSLFLQTVFWPVTSRGEQLDQPVLTLKSQTPITSGAVLKEYEWKTVRNKKVAKVQAKVIEVNLHNPLVKIDVITGTNNQFTKKQTIKNMANEAGAVAAINGDFFNTKAEGVPIGPQISNGNIMATPPFLKGLYSFAIDQNNNPVIDEFTFQGKIQAADGASYPLGGINKTYYWFEPDGKHSMIDGLYMYTSAWAQVDRSNDGVTVPTEVLVQNGIVTQIAPNKIINMVPPEDGYILRASGKAAEFVLSHLKVGEPVLAEYKIIPADPAKTYDVSQFKMMIGGGSILVDGGKPTGLTRKDVDPGYRSRTAAGYSKDGKFVYLIAVEKNANSEGINFPELQRLMIQLGVWKGLNLDGGGSTQIVARPLGQFANVLVNETENQSERKVVNGIGVFTLAPPGELKDFVISGQKNVFMNEKVTYSMSGYDQYYNPLRLDPSAATWNVQGDIGEFEGFQFTGKKPGTTVITATYGAVKKSFEVQVIGKEQIRSMKIRPSSQAIYENSSIKLPVTVTTVDGQTRTAPPDSITWELIGIEGSIEDGVLHVGGLGDAKFVQLIADYDGFRTIATLPVGKRIEWADFDNVTPPVTFDQHPKEVRGDVSVITGLPGKEGTDRALQLRYDFTEGSGTKAAYAQFGTDGMKLEGEPHSMRLNVYGDNSLNWLRAEFIDANGKSHLVDIGNKIINWTGWKTVNADLSQYGLAYPVTLKRLYVANPEQGQDERALTGAVAFDDISFLYKGEIPQSSKKTIRLTIDKKEIAVNGRPIQIDQAPVIVENYTLVPVRFVIEAFGGEIFWDPGERKVTVLKDNHLFDLWLGQKEAIMDGERITSAVAPQLINERTMVPLRLLSEKLGWKVKWDNDTRSVYLE